MFCILWVMLCFFFTKSHMAPPLLLLVAISHSFKLMRLEGEVFLSSLSAQQTGSMHWRFLQVQCLVS